jgi:NAD(P)H-hydrate epimerase
MKLVSGAEMRTIDRIAIEERGVPGTQLMEKAGQALAEAVNEDFERGRVAVVCGKGNNAGDGLVAARYLARWGWEVHVLLLTPAEQFRGDALRNWEALQTCSFHSTELHSPQALRSALSHADVIIDALLGTGLSGAPREPMNWAIEIVNASAIPVVAADVPSGLADAEELSETSPGPVVHAVRTVTMGLPKIALMTEAGLECAGWVTVTPLDYPHDLLESPSLWRHLSMPVEMASLTRARSRSGHKGTFGGVAIAAGSPGMSGALMLAGEAAARSGCGMVYLAPPAGLLALVEARLLEPVKWKLAGAVNHLDSAGARDFLERASQVNAAAIGPGLGQHPETVQAVRFLVEKLDKPLVVDADGLNALAGAMECLEGRRTPTILTPHPGELSRLMGLSVAELQNNRFRVARDFARRHRCIVVLKGAGTIIASPEGMAWCNPTGNTGLAKGGSGDVLTGLIGGLLAQGYDALSAALLGVYVHGLAADLAIERSSPRSILASDVIAHLGAAYRTLEAEKSAVRSEKGHRTAAHGED